MDTDILIVGGGTGGTAAAMRAAEMGLRVVLTEPTDWIGGQLTAQAVPPDEHPWIESHGSCRNYRRFRQGVRDYYRRHYPLTAEARGTSLLNPGNGYVSRLCHEPRVAHAVLMEMAAPHLARGNLRLLLEHEPVAVQSAGDRIEAVELRNVRTGQSLWIEAPYVLDASELGDLLELAGIEHVIGAESQRETGELHALPGDADPMDQQSITWCFALSHHPDEDHVIEQPAMYSYWQDYRPDFWPGRFFDWHDCNPTTLERRFAPIFHAPDHPDRSRERWRYRRLLDAGLMEPDSGIGDVSLINWPQNDYWGRPLLGVSPAMRAEALREAHQLSLSWLYWMQTEAPRVDGGTGYRGLRLREDVVGSHDGLAKHVYVRESRRIRAEFTVLEEHVGLEQRGDLKGAESFSDTVGTGCYRIDLHPSSANRNYVYVGSYPFQIPLGALIPVRVENVLPACKNLGVTHITNGCYRLHPVEWAIGEAAGTLAAFSLQKGTSPRGVLHGEGLLSEYQGLLACGGADLHWPDHARKIAV